MIHNLPTTGASSRATTTTVTNRYSGPGSFRALLSQYREQMTELDAATDKGEIDRLADASHDTLQRLSGTRVHDAPSLADKLQVVVDRHADGATVDATFIRDALADAYALATEPGLALAWVHLWYDLGAWLSVDSDARRGFGQPDPLVVTDRYTGKLPPHLQLQDEGEAVGASKALRILLKLAGKRAQDAVFAFSLSVPGDAGPKSWGRVRDNWRMAKGAVAAAALAGADDAEVERLDDALAAAEDALMATPSPDAAVFAFKYRIAKGGGRETDCWNDMLNAEAERFAGLEI